MEKFMSDNNSLSSNYECSLLRSMIALTTIVFCILGGFVDGNPTNHFTIWMYFLGIAPVIFIFTLIINKYTHLSLFLLFIIDRHVACCNLTENNHEGSNNNGKGLD